MNTKLYINNENKWVATDKNYKKIISSNSSLDRLQTALKKIKIENAVIMFVPPFNTTLAPICL